MNTLPVTSITLWNNSSTNPEEYRVSTNNSYDDNTNIIVAFFLN